MKVIKRSGEEVIFDVHKIENAIRKANKATSHSQMSEATILKISKQVEAQCEAMKRSHEAKPQCRRNSGYGRNRHYERTILFGGTQLYYLSL